MRIGLDFDNTIVCYDEAFYSLALEYKAIPADLPKTKEYVKDYLQRQGQNDFWTELQGIAYGPRMELASTFVGFEKFLTAMIPLGAEIFIVSHRSPKPYSGLDYDLHAAARTWLGNRSWVKDKQISMQNIYFESTKKDKIKRIGELHLNMFVDDLLEIFTDPDFPVIEKKVHFKTSSSTTTHTSLISAQNWNDVLKIAQDS